MVAAAIVLSLIPLYLQKKDITVAESHSSMYHSLTNADLLFFTWWIGVFILIYSINVTDATESMVVDRTDLTHKVSHPTFFHFSLYVIVVNGEI